MPRPLSPRRLQFAAPEIQAPFLLRSAHTVKRIDSLAVLQRIVRSSWSTSTTPRIESANGIVLAPADVLALTPRHLMEPHNNGRWVWPTVAIGCIAIGGLLALLLQSESTSSPTFDNAVSPVVVPQGGATPEPAASPRRIAQAPPTPAHSSVAAQTPTPRAKQAVIAESPTPNIKLSYQTPKNTPLLVDIQSGPLAGRHHASQRALLRSSPKRGKIGFYADGHFTYRPSPDFTGLDSFRIQITEGDNPGRMLTISIEVMPSAP